MDGCLSVGVLLRAEAFAVISYLKSRKVVFNVCGNKYRIVVLVDYIRHGMLIRFVGTHKEYDEIEDIENI